MTRCLLLVTCLCCFLSVVAAVATASQGSAHARRALLSGGRGAVKQFSINERSAAALAASRAHSGLSQGSSASICGAKAGAACWCCEDKYRSDEVAECVNKKGSECGCSSGSHPTQALSKQLQRPWFSHDDAAALLRNKRVLFVGDSANRRNMYSLAGLLQQEPFVDRYGPHHGDLVCPEAESDHFLRTANITLNFKWSSMVDDAGRRINRVKTKHNGKKVLSQWQLDQYDAILLSTFHHEHGRDWQSLVANMEQWYGRNATLPSGVPVIILTPQLGGLSTDCTPMCSGKTCVPSFPTCNRDVLAARDRMLHNAATGVWHPSVQVLDMASWMRDAPTSEARAPCLGGWTMGIRTGALHLQTQYGMALKAQAVLGALTSALSQRHS